MTYPTPESVEDALMNRLVALVDAWRANGAEPSAMALASIAGIVRKNMPPACDCDGGLFGAGPGDHAIGCPARPPEAPGERRPVAGWRETRPGLWHLDLGPFDATAETPAHNAYRPATTWGVAGKRLGAIPGTQLDAAKLAAEDAADALLLAGRRALGRVA